MKTYNQFVAESYSARENLQEAAWVIPTALGLLRGVGRLGFGAAKQIVKRPALRGTLGAIGAGRAVTNLQKDGGPERGKGSVYSAVTGAASAIPGIGPVAFGLHVGDYLHRELYGKDKNKTDLEWLKRTVGLSKKTENK